MAIRRTTTTLDTTEEVQFTEEAPLTEEITTTEVAIQEEASSVILNEPVPEKEAPGHPSRDFYSGQ